VLFFLLWKRFSEDAVSLSLRASELFRFNHQELGMRRFVWLWIASVSLALLFASSCLAQTLKPRPPIGTEQPRNADDSSRVAAGQSPVTVPMRVDAGVPIKVALESEIRVRKVGQTIHGTTVEPVYAYDKLLIPVGTKVNGNVSAIDRVPGKTRFMRAADGNFSPTRHVEVQFNELLMPDGRILLLNTVTSPAPDGVLRFVSANDNQEKKNKAEQAASKKVNAMRQQIRQQWADLQKQIHEPEKLHKLKRVALAQLPVHPQYIDAGTTFNAKLKMPLNFGTEALDPKALTEVGSPPPDGSIVHARLLTPLSSATARKGDSVAALITEPLVVSDSLILPEGSTVKGSVIQAQPARLFGRNGQLRIFFQQVAPPNGLEQKVEANLEGVAVAKGEHLKLDAEGGAEVTTPRTRYLTTGIAVMLAASQASPDRDAGQGTSAFNPPESMVPGNIRGEVFGTVENYLGALPAVSNFHSSATGAPF